MADLLDRLRDLAKQIPVSAQVASAETTDILGALVTFVQHGEDIFTAAEKGGTAAIGALLSGKSLDDALTDAQAAAEQLTPEQEIAQLKAKLATLQGSLNTQASNAATIAEAGSGSTPA